MGKQFLMAAFIFLCGFGSCSSDDIGATCVKNFPEFDGLLENGVAALRSLEPSGEPPGEPEKQSRAVASATATAMTLPTMLVDSEDFINVRDRRSWQDWGENRLKEAQHFLDILLEVADDHPINLQNMKNSLKEVANDLVSFNGYAEQGQYRKMVSTLVKTREGLKKVRELACKSQ